MTTMTSAPGEASGYPVRLDVSYPETLSRWLIFVKWLLAIPHLIITYILNYVFQLLTIIVLFIILFTGKYPEGMFKFNVGIRRWYDNVLAYIYLLRDEYPPFSMDAGQYPLVLDIEYPQNLSRWMGFVKWILAIPHYIVLIALGIGAVIAIVIAWFAILFTGKFPASLFDYMVGVLRWSERVNAYIFLMTDQYPPFSLKP